MKLLVSEIILLKETLVYNGEKEINDKGDEVKTPRRLNGKEASQRRHFLKHTEEILKKLQEELTPVTEAHNQKITAARSKYEADNARMESENDEAYNGRINGLLNADSELQTSFKALVEMNTELNNRENEVDLTPTTIEVLKKYFGEYGDTVGFMVGDDEAAAKLEEKLA